MKLIQAAILTRSPGGPAQQLVDDYLTRTQPYFPTEPITYRSEAALLAAIDKMKARTAPALILLDREGKPHSSDALAALIARYRDAGTQTLVLAIGPADGWSPAARAAARDIVSFGPITLPHELARAVLAEQLYRAATILAGHPYHAGH